jgi:hypothetical protein
MRLGVIAATLISLAGCATGGTPAAGSSPRLPLTVAQAASLKPEGQSLWVEGYVVDLYRCPPCPDGAKCEQCLDDRVVLSDLPERVEGDAYAAERRDWLFLEPGQQISPWANNTVSSSSGGTNRASVASLPRWATSSPPSRLHVETLRQNVGRIGSVCDSRVRRKESRTENRNPLLGHRREE